MSHAKIYQNGQLVTLRGSFLVDLKKVITGINDS